eukprot:6381971-Lingulodinium_polyedra.AAC.1
MVTVSALPTAPGASEREDIRARTDAAWRPAFPPGAEGSCTSFFAEIVQAALNHPRSEWTARYILPAETA